jgi:hypothetical protein
LFANKTGRARTKTSSSQNLFANKAGRTHTKTSQKLFSESELQQLACQATRAESRKGNANPRSGGRMESPRIGRGRAADAAFFATSCYSQSRRAGTASASGGHPGRWRSPADGRARDPREELRRWPPASAGSDTPRS